MFKGILLLGTILTFSGVALADPPSLEERIEQLEYRVKKLEKKTGPCLNQEDGVIPEEVKEVHLKDGKWVYGHSFVATFSFELKKKFVSPEGHELAVVRKYAPGYNPSCATHIFLAKELIFFN